MNHAGRRYARLRLIAARARRPGTPIAGPRAPATYVSELEKNGRKHGARALAVDIEALLIEVSAAHSLEDARRRVLERYGKMVPSTELAEVLRKTSILGHLSGRFDASEEA